MNVYETINLIKIKLEEGQDDPSDMLYGYKIVEDPYGELKKHVPLILIEAEKTEFITAQYGIPVIQDHHLSFTLIEEAQKMEFSIYKSKINILVKKLIDKLMTINDYRINKIIPVEMSHSEIMFDASLKATGITLSVKVRTEWEDN